MKKRFVAVVATMIAAVVFALPADARAKKQCPNTQKRYQVGQTSQSLDGRTLGRMRTCGFDFFNTMAWGCPMVPIAIERAAGLILKRASALRASGQWRDDDYDVLPP